MDIFKIEKKIKSLIVKNASLEDITAEIYNFDSLNLIPQNASEFYIECFLLASKSGNINALEHLKSKVKHTELLLNRSIDLAKKYEQWETCAILEELKNINNTEYND